MKEYPPYCKKCKDVAVKADAGVITSIPYWYCRKCKFELGWNGMEVPYVPEKEEERSIEELENYFDDFDFETDFTTYMGMDHD